MASGAFDVFLSYRREQASELAQVVCRALGERGLRVFLDVRDLGAGAFDIALLRRIEQAPDFVVLLTPGSLDRCTSSGDDWLLREIGHALGKDRNVVPLATLDFRAPSDLATLPAPLANLLRHQCALYDHRFSDESIDRLYRMLRSGRRRRRGRARRRFVTAGALATTVLGAAALGAWVSTIGRGASAGYHPNRRSVDLCARMASAVSEISILQTNLTTVLEMVDCMAEAKRRSPGLAIRVLALDPSGSFVEARGRLLDPGAARRFREESIGSLDGFVMRMRKAGLACDLRLYDEVPTMVLIRTDQRLLVAFVMAVGLGRDQPHIDLTTDLPNVDSSFLAHFDTLWRRARPYVEGPRAEGSARP